MADKPDKKESKTGLTFEAFEIIIVFIILWGLGSLLLNWVNQHKSGWFSFFNNLPYYLINIYAKYVVFSFFLSIILFILVIVYVIKENKIREKIMSKVLPPKEAVQNKPEDLSMENPKWKLVEEHINSDDANKWKLAILEADIILSELLDTLNLPGNGIGEKLKNVKEGDFNHLEEAWEGHKIRNAIAHEGSDFLLTQREAKRVIRLYKTVFEEFKII